jgi:ATP-binding cassette subfamily B protein
LLPVTILWVGKIIVGIIQNYHKGETDFSQLWKFVALEFGLVVLSDLVSQRYRFNRRILGDQYSINSSVKIIKIAS